MPENTKSSSPNEQQIRERAYEIYLSRNGDGDELSDWLVAERELKASGQSGIANVETLALPEIEKPKLSKVQHVAKKARATAAA